MVEYGSTPEEFCGNESLTPKRIPYFLLYLYRNPQFLYLTPEEFHGSSTRWGGGGGGAVTVLQCNGAVNVTT